MTLLFCSQYFSESFDVEIWDVELLQIEEEHWETSVCNQLMDLLTRKPVLDYTLAPMYLLTLPPTKAVSVLDNIVKTCSSNTNILTVGFVDECFQCFLKPWETQQQFKKRKIIGVNMENKSLGQKVIIYIIFCIFLHCIWRYFSPKLLLDPTRETGEFFLKSTFCVFG